MSALRHDPHRHGSVAPAAACPTWAILRVGAKVWAEGEAFTFGLDLAIRMLIKVSLAP